MQYSGKIFFRADASSTIGSGHIMRCLALAQVWKKGGGDAVFVCGNITPGLQSRIKAEEIEIHQLQAKPATLNDADEFAKIAESGVFSVVDGYQFKTKFFSRLQEKKLIVCQLDDNREHESYCSQFILNPNLHASISMYSGCIDSAKLLLGPAFALIRQEFFITDRQKAKSNNLRILITLGGNAPITIYTQVINALNMLDPDNLEVRIIVGTEPKTTEKLAAIGKGSSSKIEVFSAVSDMSTYLNWADIAVCAAGGTCWEMAMLGVPIIVMQLADNQVANAKNLETFGLAFNVGDYRQLNPKRLAKAINALLKDSKLRRQMSITGKNLVDGLGAKRAMQTICRTLAGDVAVQLRPARQTDAYQIWTIANEKSVRKFSRQKKDISLSEHCAWFEKKINSVTSCIWVMALAGAIVGHIRYDYIMPKIAEISICVESSCRNLGYGIKMIRDTATDAGEKLGVKTIRAWIKSGNTASQKLFQNAGFIKTANKTIQNVQWELLDFCLKGSNIVCQ